MGWGLQLLLAMVAITEAQTTCALTDLLPLASELNTSCRSIIRADLGEVGGILFSGLLSCIRMCCVCYVSRGRTGLLSLPRDDIPGDDMQRRLSSHHPSPPPVHADSGPPSA